ncbi:MAG: DUF4886 domain-containing protein [Clostridiales bacterium]|nr:DUF4886 domain-containing protein [Clostridiales bacterium]
MKILSIGNSFSDDAQHYLHSLAKHDGVQIKTVNLYIGGCTLRTHYLNMLDDAQRYPFWFNGEATGLSVSIRQALISDDWDIITLQQASHQSFDFATYTPYLEELAKYVKKYCPHAKLYIHETWGYENGSKRLESVRYESMSAMFADVKTSYQKAVQAIFADGVLPSGTALMTAAENGLVHTHRDGLHLSYGAGRYLAALTWYKTLTGNDITNNDFNDFDEPVSDEERKIVIAAVQAATR